MNLVRKIRTSNASSFNDFLSNIDEITDIYKSYGRCDFVYDQYSDDPGVKDTEAVRRSEATPVIISVIEKSTAFPRDLKRFWPSKGNKLQLEKLVYTHQREVLSSTYPIVVSTLERNNEA